jgi:hypothetical protein
VSLFGWTLGGIYLARYSDSPAGAFDELVVLAGLVWNAPTSCAWARRVYVNNRSARDHGLQHVGLPSRLATFAQAPCTPSRTHPGRSGTAEEAAIPWWNVPFAPHRSVPADVPVVIGNSENGRHGMRSPVARLQLPAAQAGWAPRIRMRLPNFSGATDEHPGLLHYTCKLDARVRPMPFKCMRALGDHDEQHPEDVSAVLRGKPVLCIEFGDLVMTVPQPEPLKVGVDASKKGAGARQLASLSAPFHNCTL